MPIRPATSDDRVVPADGDARVDVARDTDIVLARQLGRRLALDLGFSAGDATLVATAISELARNILMYAGAGEVWLKGLRQGERYGILVEARDRGPGIPDVQQALRDGYSTSNRLGLGLPGVRRLMDEFSIESGPGAGTIVRVKMWDR